MSNWVKGTTDYNGVVRCQACNCDLTGKTKTVQYSPHVVVMCADINGSFNWVK